jgi:hypothetical protein
MNINKRKPLCVEFKHSDPRKIFRITRLPVGSRRRRIRIQFSDSRSSVEVVRAEPADLFGPGRGVP